MDKKQQISIPKYIWVIAGILVICIIFLIVVQVPFSQKLGDYNKKHDSAAAEISKYNYYLANASQISKSIVEMSKEYETKSEKLFVNGTKTADDIRTMIEKLDYEPTSVSVQPGVQDSEGRMSSAGDPLYTTIVKLTFTATEEEIINTLKYFESESKGSYYISQISVKPAQESQDIAIVSEDEESQASGDGSEAASSSSASSSKTSIPNSDNTDNGDKIDAELTINLYYFNQAMNVGTSSASDESSAA